MRYLHFGLAELVEVFGAGAGCAGIAGEVRKTQNHGANGRTTTSRSVEAWQTSKSDMIQSMSGNNPQKGVLPEN